MVHRRSGAQQGHAPGELEEERADRQADQRRGEGGEAFGLVLRDDLAEHEARGQRRYERDQPDHERGEHEPHDVAAGAATSEADEGADRERAFRKGPYELDAVVTEISGDHCVDADPLAADGVDDVVAPSPSEHGHWPAIRVVPDEGIAQLLPPRLGEPHRSRAHLRGEGDGLDRRSPEQIFGMRGVHRDPDRSADLLAHGEQLVVPRGSDLPPRAALEHAAEVVEGQLALEVHGAGRGIDQLSLRGQLLVERHHLELGERTPSAVESARQLGRRAPIDGIGRRGPDDHLTAVGAGGVEPLVEEGHERRRAVGAAAVEGAEWDNGDDAAGGAAEDPAATDRRAVHRGGDRPGGQVGDQVARPRR